MENKVIEVWLSQEIEKNKVDLLPINSEKFSRKIVDTSRKDMINKKFLPHRSLCESREHANKYTVKMALKQLNVCGRGFNLDKNIMKFNLKFSNCNIKENYEIFI